MISLIYHRIIIVHQCETKSLFSQIFAWKSIVLGDCQVPLYLYITIIFVPQPKVDPLLDVDTLQ